MTETARALGAKEVSDLIGKHITAFLDGGPDREAEDVELAQEAGLKVERTMARWADAREYLLHTPPASKAAPLTGAEKAAEKPETLTALPAKEEEQPAEVVKVADVDSAGWGKRRSLAPEPAEERPALRVQNKERVEASLFLNPTQPKIEEEKKLSEKEQKQDEAISLSKLVAGLGAEKREELFKAIAAMTRR